MYLEGRYLTAFLIYERLGQGQCADAGVAGPRSVRGIAWRPTIQALESRPDSTSRELAVHARRVSAASMRV